MLNNELLKALENYTASMKNHISFVVAKGEHPKRDELMDFLNKFVSVSDYLNVRESDDESLRSPVSFLLEKDGEDTGIRFSGIPGGHEFNSLVLAVLQASGTDLKLDDSIKKLISNIDQNLNFEVFVSLSCHNCPDVVQALNQFALLNSNVQSEMIEGSVFQEEVDARNIQGVPTVFLNGQLFANGKIDVAQLLDKLLERYPEILQGSAGNENEQLPLQDVTVVGGGPAGVAAAIYSARKGLKVTLVADRIGGQVKDTMGIENLISVPKTTGPELTGALQEHLSDYEVTIKEHLRVSEIKSSGAGSKTLTLSSGEQIESKTIIVASGAKWRELGVPGEKENVGNGVAYCPHCDGPFFKGKDVAVIGGGNSGIEAALDLAGIVNSVQVFEFLPELKADEVLVKKAEQTDNIVIHKNVAVQEILANSTSVSALRYQERDSETVKEQKLDGVFVQIGLLPNTEFLKGVVDLSDFGEILINEKGETSEPGVYACGDATTVPYKQIVVAMGEGAKASLSAFEYLLKYQPETKAEAA